MIDLEKFSLVSQALLAPFDDADLSTREVRGKNLTYVDPGTVRLRLMEVFKEGYTFQVVKVENLGKEIGLLGQGRMMAAIDGVAFDISACAIEPFQIGADTITYYVDGKKEEKPNPNAGKILATDEMAQKLNSAVLKACARELGVGIYLYLDSEHKKSAGSGDAQSAPAAKQDAKPFDGTEIVHFGKHKGMMYKDVEDGYLAYCRDKMDKPPAGILKELERRRATNQQQAAAQAQSSLLGNDAEVPF